MGTMDGLKLQALDLMFGKGSRIGLTVHIHPDGDALGSSVALMRYLRGFRGKEVLLFLPDDFPGNLGFIAGEERYIVASASPEEASARLASCDLLVCLDHNSPGRTGVLEAALRSSSAPKVLIDHHLDPEADFYDLVFSDTGVSSTCELLYDILSAMPDISAAGKFPVELGTPLMAGMTTDTNNFANSVFPGTFRMASALLAAGVDRDGILFMLYNQYGENRFRAMGCFLGEKLKLLPGGIAYAVFYRRDEERFSLADGDTEGFVNMPLGIAGVRMSIFLKEDDGFFRVSVRSTGDCPSSEFARRFFHGGGHFHASGGRLHFPEDIASPSSAETYIETSAARFLQDCAPSKQ